MSKKVGFHTAIVVLLTIGAMLLTGCGKTEEPVPETTVYSTEEAVENYEAAKKNLDNIYYNTLEDLNSDEGLLGSKMPLSQRIYIWFYNTYSVIKKAAPMIIAISIFSGVLVTAISRKNKQIQKFAITYLIIGIPIATLLIVFGLGASPLFKYE